MTPVPPKLYGPLAGWFHLLTRPEDYAEEAEFYRHAITSASPAVPTTLLELGCGGGNNAFHMKRHFRLTLLDIAPQMLAVSRSINPECEHLIGDMKTVRLGRLIDAVFIHDAIGYLVTLGELSQAMATAWTHCRPGGVAVFAPDFVRETFHPGTRHGGYDGRDRGLRYLEWIWDPDPSDSSYVADYAYVLRDEMGRLQVEGDRHHLGLFPRLQWLEGMRQVGFEPRPLRMEGREAESAPTEVFLGIKSLG